MFSVLFDYHSAIEVNYVHKIKKEMRQGSLRKTVKLMNRTTFKNYMTQLMMERERKKGGIKEREDGGREGGDYLRELIN